MTQFMTYREHARALLVLGLPLVGGHLGQIAINMTDTLMLGWYSVEALAAVVVASSYFFTLFITGSGFGWAVMPMVAQASETGEVTQIRRVTRMALWLSMAYGVAVLPLMLFSKPVLEAIGQAPELASNAQTYLRIAAWGVFPALAVMVLKSYLAALEHTRVVLWVTLAAAVLNAAVNYVLIFGAFGFPEMGVRGAAVASVMVQVLSLILLVIYATRLFPEHTLFTRFWRIDAEALVHVLRIGTPIGMTTLTETGLFAAATVMMGWLGTVPVAAHGVALQIASATFVVHLGLSNAATVRAGRAVGRGDGDHLARGGRVAIALSVAISAVTICVFVTIPATLIGAFVDPSDPVRPAIIQAGVGLVYLAALFQLVDGLQVIALGMLRGAQDTRVPMVQATISYWVIGLPASYIFGFVLGWGGVGVWIGLVLGLAMAAVSLMHRFWWRVLPRVAGHPPEKV